MLMGFTLFQYISVKLSWVIQVVDTPQLEGDTPQLVAVTPHNQVTLNRVVIHNKGAATRWVVYEWNLLFLLFSEISYFCNLNG